MIHGLNVNIAENLKSGFNMGKLDDDLKTIDKSQPITFMVVDPASVNSGVCVFHINEAGNVHIVTTYSIKCKKSHKLKYRV